MPNEKKFICSNFNPSIVCGYETQGLEDVVVEKATQHIVEEHGFMDSPQLREDVKNSLVDVP